MKNPFLTQDNPDEPDFTLAEGVSGVWIKVDGRLIRIYRRYYSPTENVICVEGFPDATNNLQIAAGCPAAEFDI